MRVGQQHPVRGGIADPLVVDLEPVVQRRTPRRAEPAARPIRRHVGALQRPRQQAGQLKVELRQDHLPAGHIHRIKFQKTGRGGLRELIAVLQRLTDSARRLQDVGTRRPRLAEGRTTDGTQAGTDELQPLAAGHPPSQPDRGTAQLRDTDDPPPTRNKTERVQRELP